MSISAGARLFFFTILVSALKVGSESLPLVSLPSKSFRGLNRKSHQNNASIPRTNNEASSLPIDKENPSSNANSNQDLSTTPGWTLSQQSLARSLSQLHLVVAIWAFLVSLGQAIMKRGGGWMRSTTMAPPEMLFLAAMLCIKSYRLWLSQGQQTKDPSTNLPPS